MLAVLWQLSATQPHHLVVARCPISVAGAAYCSATVDLKSPKCKIGTTLAECEVPRVSHRFIRLPRHGQRDCRRCHLKVIYEAAGRTARATTKLTNTKAHYCSSPCGSSEASEPRPRSSAAGLRRRRCTA